MCAAGVIEGTEKEAHHCTRQEDGKYCRINPSRLFIVHEIDLSESRKKPSEQDCSYQMAMDIDWNFDE